MTKSMALVFTTVLILLILCAGTVYAADLLPDGRRDVLATIFDYPVMTDADVDVYFTETRALITTDGGPVLFRYPGITGVSADSNAPEGTVVQPGLLRVEMSAGTHEIQVLADGDGDIAPSSASENLPDTPDELAEAVSSANPGDEIVVRDGTYRDWRTQLSGQGTADAPIVVRPETPGGVVLHGQSAIVISGQFVFLRGFRFEQCNPGGMVQLQDASDCRVSQCHFCHCGNPQSTFSHIVRVYMGCDRNRVDHCFFVGNRSMGIGQIVGSEGEVGRDNRYDHNIFRDVYRYSSNGQENIQLGQNQRDRGHLEPRATVEYNLFNYAWGDGEIISNKSSANLVQHNVAAHCVRSAFTLRGGNEVRFDGNVMFNNAGGLRVMGKRHTIVNNLFMDQSSFGVRLETGRLDSRLNIETDGTIIANNTILGCGNGISGMEPTEVRPHRPGDNEFSNNLIAGTRGILLQTEYFDNSTVRRNLVYPTEDADAGHSGSGVQQADPRLVGEGVNIHPAAASPAVDAAVTLAQVSDDRWNRARPHGDAPDIGADEVGAAEPEEAVLLPEIPPEPVLDLGLYMGEAVPGADDVQTLELTDETTELDAPLPAECVIAWDHHPAAYDATSTLALTDAAGQGYQLRWRGTNEDGMPHGKLELLRASDEQLLTEGTDLARSWRDFPRNAWRDAEDEADRPTPGENEWWRFTLMKMQDRVIVLMQDQYAGGMQVPVLTWNEHDPSGALDGPLTVTMSQQGTGTWAGFYACRHEYAADTPPATPGDISAETYGGQRVGLSWQATRARRSGSIYEIFRGTSADFTANEQTKIAGHVTGGGYDDFAVEPDTEYHYRIRAKNSVGLVGEPASVQVETATGGPLYRLIPATAATAEPPMAILQETFEGHRYISTPGAGSPSREEAPAEGLAEIPLGNLEKGEYSIWALLWAPSKGADSFWISLDGTSQEKFRQWSTGVHPHWEWTRCRQDVQFDAGEHVLRLKYREPTTRLAAVLVTADPDFSPSGR